jgi:hypothetical protein
MLQRNMVWVLREWRQGEWYHNTTRLAIVWTVPLGDVPQHARGAVRQLAGMDGQSLPPKPARTGRRHLGAGAIGGTEWCPLRRVRLLSEGAGSSGRQTFSLC